MWHFVADWLTFDPFPKWKRCGMGVIAASEAEAVRVFWEEYHQLSEDVRPWREIWLDRGPAGPIRRFIA